MQKLDGGYLLRAGIRQRLTNYISLPPMSAKFQYIGSTSLQVKISRAIARELQGVTLDILYNNAGVYLEKDYKLPEIGSLRYDEWLRTLEVNTLGAVRVTEALLDNVADSNIRLVAVMTSHMGSIADIDTPGSYYYRSSKAALNAAMHGLLRRFVRVA